MNNLSIGADDVHIQANEPRLVERGTVDERLAVKRNRAILEVTVVVGAFPLVHVLALRHHAVNVNGLDRKHGFLARLVGERILVRRSLQPYTITRASHHTKRGEGNNCERSNCN